MADRNDAQPDQPLLAGRLPNVPEKIGEIVKHPKAMAAMMKNG